MELNEPDIDPEAQEQKLIQEAEQAKRQEEQKQAEILEAIKQDEEIVHGETEWVKVGDAEFKVMCDPPGEVTDTLEALENPDPDKQPTLREVVKAVGKIVEVIQYGDVSMTTRSEIDGFFEMYYEEHGPKVLHTAMSRLLEPALNGMEQMVPNSFQGQ
jgi:hypothetical protein